MMITGIVRADIDALDDCDGDESARQEMIADNDADVVAETAKAARRQIQHADIDADYDESSMALKKLRDGNRSR